ncbi:thioredoxin family protein [Thermoleophilia bacterium SCSIO 60948]|nr:thioredoxin family protein [Thermoleophilia bacterium SCSIO 60948]
MSYLAPSRAQLLCALALAAIAVPAVACSKDESGEDGSGAAVASVGAPPASEFPKAPAQITDVVGFGEQTDETVVLPGTQAFDVGENRASFGVFDVDRTQDTDASIAIYAQNSEGGEVLGPFPTAIESLETPAAFVAQSTSTDPDSAKAIYVTDIDFPEEGFYDLAAVIDDGDDVKTTFIPSVPVGSKSYEQIPDVGEQAPVTHTDTIDDVSNVAEIDTRVPAGTMHDVDLADVLGEEPVVLLFATPALCMTQVCGPVVDIAEEVKSERPDDAAYIHQEVYVDNNPEKGIRQPLKDYGLKTEPWLFVIDSDGKIVERIEGAFSKSELEAAIDKAQPAGESTSSSSR